MFPRITHKDNFLYIHDCREYYKIVKLIPGRRYDSKHYVWRIPISSHAELEKLLPNCTYSDDARGAIAKHQERMSLVNSMKLGLVPPIPSSEMPIKATPYEHQITAYNIAMSLDNCALLMEQGTGKTMVSIAVLGRRYLDGQINSALVTCPACVMPVWEKELLTYANFDCKPLIIGGGVRNRKNIKVLSNGESDGLNVAICNYESVWRKHINDYCTDYPPDMVIADESQRIKNYCSKQSGRMHELGADTRYKMILTGTPVSQSPLDFFSQYKFLDSSVFGTNYYSFRRKYAIMGGYEDKQIIGYQNTKDLVQKAHSIAYRVTKADALDLPEQVFQNLYCDLEPQAEKEYKKLCVDGLAQFDGHSIKPLNALTMILRLSQLTGGFLKSDERIINVSNAKMKLLDETIEDLGNQKIVIFARFVPEIKAIQQMCRKKGLKYATVYGGTADKGEEVSRFQNDKDCRIFIGQTQASGLGVTLHSAHTVIFYSLDYSYANYDQCLARVHRIGQTNKCTYIHLLAKGTVDEKVLGVLKRKGAVADDVVDNWKEYFK